MTKERTRTRSSPGRQLLRLCVLTLLGAALGAILAAARPRQFVAETVVYFPTLNSQVYAQLTQALRADPMDQETSASSFVSPPASDTQELATLILTSRAAASYCLNQAGSTARATWWDPDPIERFRTRQLKVDSTQSRGLELSVRAGSPELARQLCEALINYYSDFVKDKPLTVTGATRKKTEAELAFASKKLAGIEKELFANGNEKPPGDPANPKVAREIYRRRLDQGSQSRRVLETMHRIRETSPPVAEPRPDASATPAPLNPDEWNKQWNSSDEKKEDPRPGAKFGEPVRSTDLFQRIQLERRYEDNLLLYRSLLLQNSFLRTWEALETDRLEILDPIAVHSAERIDRTWALYGGLAGLLAGILLLALRSSR